MTKIFHYIFFPLFLLSTLCANETASLSLSLPEQVRAGQRVEGVIELSLKQGWHLYWKNPGEAGLAPTFDWDLPEGITLASVQWPTPSIYSSGPAMLYGYENAPKWVVSFQTQKELPEGNYPISLSAHWLGCNDSCVPEEQQVSTSISISSSAAESPSQLPELLEARQELPLPSNDLTASLDDHRLSLSLSVQTSSPITKVILFPEQQGLFPVEYTPSFSYEPPTLYLHAELSDEGSALLRTTQQFAGVVTVITEDHTKHSYRVDTALLSDRASTGPMSKTWFTLLFFAFLGGVILNITPCALPVIGLRILQLISSQDKEKTVPHGLAYTLGVLVCFWSLAAVLYSLEHFGSTIGWGFQLQEPRFVALLIIILFLLALNLFGVVEIGLSISAWASNVQTANKRSLLTSFVTGLLATVVATPCTGPLLGSVLGFAVTFHPIEGFILFTCMGLGMAFPFLLVSIFPSLIRWIPKPGPWMEGLKQFFGFVVLATLVWLLWVLEGLVPYLTTSLLAFALLLLSAAMWIYGRWGSPVRVALVRYLAYTLCLILLFLGSLSVYLSFDSSLASYVQKAVSYKKIPWQPYSEQRLFEELKKGKTVFVKFTAKWCLTCQTNALTFLLPSVVETFAKHDIVALEADWTDGDPRITAKLRDLGRNGVPLTVVFKQGKDPDILPEIVTPENISLSIKLMETS